MTDDGIIIDFKFKQLLKAFSFITTTDDGIVTLIRLVQPSNADSPMILTDDGISTVVNDVHNRKKFDGISVQSDRIVICLRYLQFSSNPFSILKLLWLSKESNIFSYPFSSATLNKDL